jgi:hypothetical protein
MFIFPFFNGFLSVSILIFENHNNNPNFRAFGLLYNMKKLYLIIVSILILSTGANAQYKINKSKYDYRTYKYQDGDPYKPGIAGFASFLIPGLGQMSSGAGGRGAAFLGGFVGCLTIYGIGSSHYYEDEEGTHGGPVPLYIGLIGALTIDLISVIDAVRVAKVTNLYFRDKYMSRYSLKASPYLGSVISGKIPLGLSLSLQF